MLTVGAVVFLLLGLAVPAVLIAKLVRGRHLRRHGATAEGKVVAVSPGDDSDWAIVVFRDHRARAHQFRSDEPYPAGKLKVGMAVPVRYDPADPRIARELGRPRGRALQAASWLFVAGVSGIIGAGLLPV